MRPMKYLLACAITDLESFWNHAVSVLESMLSKTFDLKGWLQCQVNQILMTVRCVGEVLEVESTMNRV